jgi:hypothetical protein
MISCSHQLDEHLEHVTNSRHDDRRERYAGELADLRADDMMQQWYEEYMTKVWNAGYGTDADAYEAYWARTLKYYEQCQ